MEIEERTGTVTYWNPRGFGYILTEDESMELFVLWKDILGEGYKHLTIGDAVIFTIGSNRRGPIARKVRRHF